MNPLMFTGFFEEGSTPLPPIGSSDPFANLEDDSPYFELLQQASASPPPAKKRKKLSRPFMQAGLVQRVAGHTPQAKALKAKEGGIYSCSACKAAPRPLRKMVEHIRKTHHLRDQCTLCNRTLSLYRGANHILSHHRTEQRVCEVINKECEKREESLERKHPFFESGILRETDPSPTDARLIGLDEGRFGCSQCPKINTASRIHAIYHRKRIHQGVKDHCTICEKDFSFQQGIAHVRAKHAHEERVINAKRDSSKVAPPPKSSPLRSGQATERLEFLDKEQLTPLCHPYFKQGILLITKPKKSSAKILEKEGKFACSLCPNTYPAKESALLHVRTQHEGERCFCTLCEKVLHRYAGIIHVKRKHATHRRVSALEQH